VVQPAGAEPGLGDLEALALAAEQRVGRQPDRGEPQVAVAQAGPARAVRRAERVGRL